MKCSVDGPNAKVIAKAILALSKFGNDLFVEADEYGLQLRSLNSMKSAMGTIKFNKPFFDIFHINDKDENFCRIGMKASVGIFRNMKQVEHCEMSIMAEEAKFQLKLKCRMDTMKDIVLSIVDEENISTDISTNDMSNRIIGTHQIFTEISNNFNTVEEEITLEAHNDCLIAKNYIEGSLVNDKFMRSQLKLLPTEFESFQIAKETSITFCLKEFRAFLLFAEAVHGTMDLNFDEAGSPICIKIKKFNDIECMLIMSTLSPEDISFCEDDCNQDSRTLNAIPHNNTEMQELHKSNSPPKRKLSNKSTTDDANNGRISKKKSIASDTTISDASTCFDFNQMTGSTHIGTSESINMLRASKSNEHCKIANPPEILPQSEILVTFGITEDSEMANDDIEIRESVPPSPPNQQAYNGGNTFIRSIFSRCFESTYVPKEPSPTSEIFVPDSDTEN